ncbi:glycosyl hydrolase family 71-domain-containing protein [Podospora appendiculata]|uniref:Glycosyl hydrolase family 71-domain-containing protein n=1 Tax=Podospora appendiculata TaxID=314037 RepID=A0AAE0WZ94_9PEZI|nr:glycosyl hydrolase family 71-domain-containing protein [Podospora appendiculata]
MKLALVLTLALSWALDAHAKAVFAHFMVGNTESYTGTDWGQDIQLAKAARIDASVLNIARGEAMNTKSIADAFSWALTLNFKLLFSFDYAGRGAWEKEDGGPWFYMNSPGFANKNWAWRGDHLWYDRWEQVKFWQPEWVCILTWNDYGESHHIGPILDNAMGAFEAGLAKYNYAHDHDGWRALLPHQIDLYKYDTVKITQEGASFWYRPNLKDACPSGGTTVNTASQLQLEFRPQDVLEDRIYYSVLATSETNLVVTISIGSVNTVGGTWRNKPAGGVGIYHGSVPINGRTGPVYLLVMRGTTQIASIPGTYITNAFACQFGNCLAKYCGTVQVASTEPTVSPFLTPSCISGTSNSAGNYESLCSYTCAHGFCPIALCTCSLQGPLIFTPPILTDSASSLQADITGICRYGCERGMCPSFCTVSKSPVEGGGVVMLDDTSCVTGVSHLDRDCFRFEECVMLDVLSASSCGAGYKRVGVDQADCGNNGAPLSNCHWVGQGDCADNTCNAAEVVLARSPYEGDSSSCNWGRNKVLCCTPNDAAFDEPTCGGIEPCPVRNDPEYPCIDPWADLDDADLADPVIQLGIEARHVFASNHSEVHSHQQAHRHSHLARHSHSSTLEKRANKPWGKFTAPQLLAGIVRQWIIRYQSAGYPGVTKLHSQNLKEGGTKASDYIFGVEQSCGSGRVSMTHHSTVSDAI